MHTSPDADQSWSRKGLRYARMDRHREVTFQPHALRWVVKPVDWEGPCCPHETSRNLDEEDLTRVSGGSWVALHSKSHPPHGGTTRKDGPPAGGRCVLPTPGRAGVSTPRLVMKDPEEIHADARSCPLCGAARIPGQLLGGTTQRLSRLLLLGPILGNSFEESGVTFSPATPRNVRSKDRHQVVTLACTNCGFIGMFVLHPENLPANDQ